MDINGITQLATLLVSVLAIIWHQQRSIDKLRRATREDNRELRREFREDNRELRRELRREFRRESRKLRADLDKDNKQLRADLDKDNKQLRADLDKDNKHLRADHGELRRAFQRLADSVADNGRKLARIEGFLGIGMPAAAAAGAPGAELAATSEGAPGEPFGARPHDSPGDGAPQSGDSD